MKKILMTMAMAVTAMGLLGGCGSEKTDEAPVENEAVEETEGTAEESTEPEVTLDIDIMALTEEDFAEVDTTEFEGAVAEDFAKVEIELNMTGMIEGTEREIKMTSLREIMAEKEIGTYCTGSGKNDNDAENNYTKMVTESIIYRKDVSDDELKKIFENESVTVNYVNAEGETVEELIPFIENVQFK